MTIDISPYIENAIRNAPNWDVAAVREALRVLASSASNSQTDWEEGDEEWGRIIVDNEHVAIVCARIPLAIVNESLTRVGNEWAKKHAATVLTASDFDEKTFSVDRTLLERAFGREVSSNVSYESLSINDLWWATV